MKSLVAAALLLLAGLLIWIFPSLIKFPFVQGKVESSVTFDLNAKKNAEPPYFDDADSTVGVAPSADFPETPALEPELPSEPIEIALNRPPVGIAPAIPPVEDTPVPAPEEVIEYLPDTVEARLPGDKTVAARLRQYGPAARKRLTPRFREAGLSYPPAKVVFVGLKQERLLKVYAAAAGRNSKMKFVCQYPIVAGGPYLGPKLIQGDRQTPEGIYKVVLLNPESAYHLSIGIDYPNQFDRRYAQKEKRKKPGGDIMIHGDCLSDGCLAMGNTAATDLFVLVADTGLKNCEVVLSPVDFRAGDLPEDVNVPEWTDELYEQLRKRLAQLDDGVSTQASIVRYRDTAPAQATPSAPADAATVLVELLRMVKRGL